MGCDDECIIPDFVYKHKNTLRVLKIISKTVIFTNEFYDLTNLEILSFSNFDVNKFGNNLKKLVNLKKIDIFRKEDENSIINDEFFDNLPSNLIDVSMDIESSRKILKKTFNNVFYCLTDYLNDELEYPDYDKNENLLIDKAYIEIESYLCINCYVYEYLGKNAIKILEHNIPHNVEHFKIALGEVYKWYNLPPTLKLLDIHYRGLSILSQWLRIYC